ncbi:MAG: zf-HC2 domain-containing protein [Chloroflexi bacterium]|nr:zf-HC2 domain-containing protein [Chloroflexota bacterium]
MNRCQPVRDRLDAYVDGESSPAVRQRVEDHLCVCQECREELASLRRLVQNTGHLFAGSGPPEGFDAAVMAAIRSQGRGAASGMPIRTPVGTRYAGMQYAGVPHAGTPAGVLHGAIQRTWRRLGEEAGLVYRSALRPNHPAALAAALLLVLTTLCMGKLSPLVGRRQSVVMVSGSLAWNSHAWLGIQAFADEKSKEPLPGAPVEIQARRAASGPWFTLFEGQTDARGSVDAWFCLPPELLGACEVRVQTGDGWMPYHIVRPVIIARHAKVLRC